MNYCDYYHPIYNYTLDRRSFQDHKYSREEKERKVEAVLIARGDPVNWTLPCPFFQKHQVYKSNKRSCPSDEEEKNFKKKK